MIGDSDGGVAQLVLRGRLQLFIRQAYETLIWSFPSTQLMRTGMMAANALPLCDMAFFWSEVISAEVSSCCLPLPCG